MRLSSSVFRHCVVFYKTTLQCRTVVVVEGDFVLVDYAVEYCGINCIAAYECYFRTPTRKHVCPFCCGRFLWLVSYVFRHCVIFNEATLQCCTVVVVEYDFVFVDYAIEYRNISLCACYSHEFRRPCTESISIFDISIALWYFCIKYR